MDVSTTPDWRRVIALVDLDCFYCQCEHKRLGIPITEPLGVTQWGALIAINYAARRAGISRGDNAVSAKKKIPTIHLPHVQVILGDGSLADGVYTDEMRAKSKVTLVRYRDESFKVLSIYQRFCPLVERASIDEAYLDLTAQVDKLYAQYQAAPNEQKEWKWQSLVLGGGGGSAGGGTGAATDFAPSSETEIRLYFGAQIVAEVRAAVFAELGYTCSGGVAHNRKFAKLIASKNKPNGQTVLIPRALPELLRTISYAKIQGFGGKLGDEVESWAGPVLLPAAGSATTAAAAGSSGGGGGGGSAAPAPATPAVMTPHLLTTRFSLAQFSSRFGPECGMWMWRVLHGCDDEPVKTVEKIKSFAASKNVPATTTVPDLPQHIHVVCVELVTRIRNDYAQFHRIPLLFGVHYRARAPNETKFSSNSRSVSMPKCIHSESTPYETCVAALVKAATLLLPKVSATCFTNVGVGASNFVEAPRQKQSITRFFGATAASAAAGGGGGSTPAPTQPTAAAGGGGGGSSAAASAVGLTSTTPIKPKKSSAASAAAAMFAKASPAKPTPAPTTPASAPPAPAASAPLALTAPNILQAPNAKAMNSSSALGSFAHHHKKHKKFNPTSAASTDAKNPLIDRFMTSKSPAAASPLPPPPSPVSAAPPPPAVQPAAASAPPNTAHKRKAESQSVDDTEEPHATTTSGGGGGGGEDGGDDSFTAAMEASDDDSFQFASEAKKPPPAAADVDAFFDVGDTQPDLASTAPAAAAASAASGGGSATATEAAGTSADSSIEIEDTPPDRPAPALAPAPSAQVKTTPAVVTAPSVVAAVSAAAGGGGGGGGSETEYFCKQCRKHIPIIDQTEHTDFHLAQKLSNQWTSAGVAPVGSADLQSALAAHRLIVAANLAAAAQATQDKAAAAAGGGASGKGKSKSGASANANSTTSNKKPLSSFFKAAAH